MLRIRTPKRGFVEIAEEAEARGTYDDDLLTILKLLQKAARERDATRTHLLSVSLHAFLYHKGGNYALPTRCQSAAETDALALAAPVSCETEDRRLSATEPHLQGGHA